MPKADLVLKNANVITMNARQPAASVVAVSSGRIRLVGGDEVLAVVIGAKTQVIDCQGKTVLPGFNDAHCHLFSFIRKLLSLDLSPPGVKSIADIKVIIHQQAQKTPPEEWIIGTDYNDFYLAEKRHPTRRDLDEVAPYHPVILSHRGLHACVLNSRALALAGITNETPAPPGGIIERDLATGEPNGLLLEMLGYVRRQVMPQLTDAELDKGAVMANQQYLACGVTSLQEATVRNDYLRWEILRHFKESGRLKSRVYMMLDAAARQQFMTAGMRTGTGDENLRLGSVKLMMTGTTGRLYPLPDELNQQALECCRDGFQLAFHAVEEEAVAAAIDALEYVSQHLPQSGRRHRIEHCSECPTPLLEGLKRLQTVVVTQPPFLYYSGERYLATLSPHQLSVLYRVKSFLERGMMVAGSSDAPVVPGNPLMGIYAAVTRRAATGQLLLPGECVSVQQALAMYTINAAYASLEEDIKGSLVPGKLADMVVLSADPTRVPLEEIKNIKVVMTIIGGRVVWED